MPWVDVLDRLPDFGRWVSVWGNHCRDGEKAPSSYRRRETSGYPYWFWNSTEWRGTSGIFWWWDDAGERVKNAPPPDPGWRPLLGPADVPHGMSEDDVAERYRSAGIGDGG